MLNYGIIAFFALCALGLLAFALFKPKPTKVAGKPTEPIPPRITWSSYKLHTYKCQHLAPDQFEIIFNGRQTRRFKGTGLCAECTIEQCVTASTICASCGKLVLPGDTVSTRYASALLPYVIEANTLGGDLYVGCMDPKCNVSRCCVAGTWTPTGLKRRKTEDEEEEYPDFEPYPVRDAGNEAVQATFSMPGSKK